MSTRFSIYFMHYNFCRMHQTLRVTPAMAANVTDKLWDMMDVARMIERYEAGELEEAEREFGGRSSLCHVAAESAPQPTTEIISARTTCQFDWPLPTC